MSVYDGVGLRFKQRNDERREGRGTTFKILSNDERDGTQEKGFVRDLAVNDFPLIQPENLQNARELNPRILDCLAEGTMLRDLDFLLLPAAGDPKLKRYRASNVQEVFYDDIVVRTFALIYTMPDLS